MKMIEMVATVKVFAYVESDNEEMNHENAKLAAEQALQQKVEQLCGTSKEHVDNCGTCVVTVRKEPEVVNVEGC